MIYRLKPLSQGITVSEFLISHGCTSYSLVGRGKAVLDPERYFACLNDSRQGAVSYFYASDLTRWEEILHKLDKVEASLLIVNSELSLILQPKQHQTILYCRHPKALFAQLVSQSADQVETEPITQFSPAWKIGPNTIIERGARLGENICIDANCYIHGNVSIGNNVTIKANTVIGGQGFEFYEDEQDQRNHFPHCGGVIVEDDVHIGSGVVIDAAMFDNTTVKCGTKIDNLTSIAHNVHIGKDCLIMANVSLAGSVRVGDLSRICLSASIRDGVSIGSNTVVGMHSCVTRDVPDGVTSYGVPAVIASAQRKATTTTTAADLHALTRMTRLIREVAHDHFQLDLTGYTVITEAATGPFAATASIAALSGAQVQAIATDSPFGTAAEAAHATMQLAGMLGVSNCIKVVHKEEANFPGAQIITNLGFVRPLDASLIGKLQRGAIIPLMYDVRELRPDEIDLSSCRDFGIRVIGTNENHASASVLRYCGPLAVKLLMEQGIEVQNARIAIAGDNFFTPHILQALERLHADVTIVSHWHQLDEQLLPTLDALLYVDYWQKLGAAGQSEIFPMLPLASGASVIQFVGGLDIEPFAAAGWGVCPASAIPPHRMWRTLAHLGPRPVIELHAAGLKAAELELRGISHDTGSTLDGLRQPIVSFRAVEARHTC